MPPSFETPRLLTRPRTLADTDACLPMDRDPEVVRFVDGPWSDPIAHRAFVEARTAAPTPLGSATGRSRSGTAAASSAGCCSSCSTSGPEVEIGWRLRRAAWGRGFASEAAAVVLRHGLGALALPKIVADIDPASAASARVAEKIGCGRWARSGTPTEPLCGTRRCRPRRKRPAERHRPQPLLTARPWGRTPRRSR